MVDKIVEVPIEDRFVRTIDVPKEVRVPQETVKLVEVDFPVKRIILKEVEKRVNVPIEEIRVKMVDKVYY